MLGSYTFARVLTDPKVGNVRTTGVPLYSRKTPKDKLSVVPGTGMLCSSLGTEGGKEDAGMRQAPLDLWPTNAEWKDDF